MRKWFLASAAAFLVTGVVGSIAFASGGPGATLGAVGGATPTPETQAKIDFAKCLCKIIDGAPAGPGGTPPAMAPCLPAGLVESGKMKKKDGCIRIATKAEIKAYYKQVLKEKAGATEAEAEAAAASRACLSADGKTHANGIPGEGKIFFPWPDAPLKNPSVGNDYQKKATLCDELSDIAVSSATDPALGKSNPLFAPAQDLYINLKSTVEVADFLNSIEPMPPPAGATPEQTAAYNAAKAAWLKAATSNAGYMVSLVKDLCAALVPLAKAGYANTPEVLAMQKCKELAAECFNARVRPRLAGGGRRQK